MKLLQLRKTGFIWVGMLWSVACYGQDINVPLGALPMEYNSSFAGEAGGPRISSSFGYGRKRYASVFSSSTSYINHTYALHTSYDQFIPKLRSGIGFTAGLGGSSADNYSSGSQYMALAIAPKFPVKGKVTISPSLDIYYSSYNASSSSFAEDWKQRGNSLGSRAGLLVNTPKFYIGYSATILSYTSDKYSYRDSTYSWARPKGFTSFLQMGYTFQRSSESKFSFTPQVVFRIGNVNRFYGHNLIGLEAVNLNFRYKKFIWGISNAGLHIGLQTKRLKATLADNYGFSSSGSNSNVANLSLRYTFSSDK